MTELTASPGAGAAAAIVGRMIGYVRLARDNDFPVGIDESLDALRLAEGIDLATPGQLRSGLKALLCAGEGDWRRFDRLFDAYWLGRGVKRAGLISGAGGSTPGTAAGGPPPDLPPALLEVAEGAGGEAHSGTGEARRAGASAAEALGKTDLRHIDDAEELAKVYELARRLAARIKQRLTRRERVHAKGRRLDLRNTIHRSLAYGGTPMRLAFRARRTKPMRLVIFLDVSGSMSLYSTFFIRFIRGVIDNFRHADAFVFHTRLVHIGPALRERNLERAIERLGLMSAGWSGGTRIGESLATFDRNYAEGTLNRRTIVIVVSDGYDTGPPELLAKQVRLLHRRARLVIWLNPMIGWRGYEPVAAGMAAALPHIDLFAPAHNIESLAALEPYLAQI